MSSPAALAEGRRTRRQDEALRYRGDVPTRAALRRRARMRVWDLVALPLLVLLALVPLWPAYGVPRFAVVVLLAVGAGTALARWSARQAWRVLPSVLAVLLAFVLLQRVLVRRRRET